MWPESPLQPGRGRAGNQLANNCLDDFVRMIGFAAKFLKFRKGNQMGQMMNVPDMFCTSAMRHERVGIRPRRRVDFRAAFLLFFLVGIPAFGWPIETSGGVRFAVFKGDEASQRLLNLGITLDRCSLFLFHIFFCVATGVCEHQLQKICWTAFSGTPWRHASMIGTGPELFSARRTDGVADFSRAGIASEASSAPSANRFPPQPMPKSFKHNIVFGVV